MYVTSGERRKARRQHKCWLCEQPIPVGTVYGRNCTFDDGHATEMKYHFGCQDVLHWFLAYWELEDGIIEGAVRELLADNPDAELSFVEDDAERKRLEALRIDLVQGRCVK